MSDECEHPLGADPVLNSCVNAAVTFTIAGALRYMVLSTEDEAERKLLSDRAEKFVVEKTADHFANMFDHCNQLLAVVRAQRASDAN